MTDLGSRTQSLLLFPDPLAAGHETTTPHHFHIASTHSFRPPTISPFLYIAVTLLIHYKSTVISWLLNGARKCGMHAFTLPTFAWVTCE
jgi:hypothetical protein